jgi:hypothetical protein
MSEYNTLTSPPPSSLHAVEMKRVKVGQCSRIK